MQQKQNIIGGNYDEDDSANHNFTKFQPQFDFIVDFISLPHSVVKGLPPIRFVAVGQQFYLALAEDGKIYKFSHLDNEFPTLFNHNVKESINFIIIKNGLIIFITNNFNVYTSVNGDYFIKTALNNIIQCIMGNNYAMLLSLTGQVYISIPIGFVVIPNLNNIIKIAAGDDHFIFIR